MSRKIIKKPQKEIIDKNIPFSQVVLKYISLFRDEEQNRYCIFEGQNEEKQIYNINSQDFENALSRLYLNIYKSFIIPAEMKTIIKGINAIAANEPIKIVGTRLLQVDNKLVYKLYNNNQIVVISDNGATVVRNDNFECLFVNTPYMKPQQIPDLNSQPCELLPALKDLFVLSDDDYILLAVYICTLFVKEIQHPILTAYGDFGSGKSTALSTISKIIDPTSRDLIYLNKNNIRDFQITLTKNYFTAFDNVTGKLNDMVMNMLCQVVTGGTISIRKLYTNTEEITIPLKRCLAINGTEIIGRRNDLLERSLLVKFKRLPENLTKSDSEYSQALKEKLPVILGSVFNILSLAIKKHNENDFQLPFKPRMLEWTTWGFCCAETIETGLGQKFCELYRKNLESSNTVAILENPYISSVVSYIKENGDYIGTSTEFFNEIIEYAQENGYDIRDKRFPTCITQVWQKMKNFSTNFKKMGISIYEPVNKGSYRELKILLESKNNCQH